MQTERINYVVKYYCYVHNYPIDMTGGIRNPVL